MHHLFSFSPKSTHYLLFRLVLGVIFFLFLAAIPLFMPPPGLQQAEPIGKYLNGNLPSLTPGAGEDLTWDIEIAYPQLFFEEPIAMQSHPREKRLFVASRTGLIESFVDTSNVSMKETLVDLRNLTSVVHDGGLLGLALHPEFGLSGSPNRNYFYVFHTVRGEDGSSGPFTCDDRCFSCFDNASWYGSYMRLSRFTVNEGTYSADINSEQILINVRQLNGSHRGGGLLFAPDGYLYLSIGEQARFDGAQNIQDNFEGGVIRIDVDKKGGSISHPPRRKMGEHTGFLGEITGMNYYIPNDNPWISPDSSQFEEFYAIGLRNPHRMTLDEQTGDIWIGDVGHASKEEIDKLSRGANFGWPLYEANIGPIPRCNINNISLGTLTAPEAQLDRSDVECVIGGYVYRGDKHPGLYGKFIYGDCISNRVFARDEEGNQELLMNFLPSGQIMTFGEDSDGEILIGRKETNTTLYRIISRNANPPAPTLLSQTGAFKDLTTLEPEDGVIPYEMIEEFWSDGAEKFRWMAIPNDGSHDSPAEQISYSRDGNWNFPTGAVLIKHFELGGKKLETRFEVHAADGKYYYLTYKWNPTQTDANLLIGSLDEEVNVNGLSQTWHYPSRSECLSCHQSNAGFVLGPKTRHLNSSITYPQSGISANQVYSLSHLGILNQSISEEAVENLPRIPSYEDPNASIEDKARAYLDLNCSYCHQPGASNRAQFDARFSTPFSQQKIVFGGVNSPLGLDNAKVIVPGDTLNSMLYHRVNSLTEGIAMPPLAKNLIDAQGIALLKDWILSMDARENPGGKGLFASYFHDDNLSEMAFSRIDPAIEFYWQEGSPDANMEAETFSTRWEGELQSLGSGNYTFYAQADQQIRLWIDRQLILDTWNQGSQQELSAQLFLGENTRYKIRMEYRHLTGDAFVRLGWSGPAFDKEIIPQYQLFPTSANNTDLGGRGLLATYFNNSDFTNEALQRIDPEVSFNWGIGSPAPNILAHTFSVRWEGNLEVTQTGSYTFFTETDDGCRLWVNDQLIIDKWVLQGKTEWDARIDLTAGVSIPIRMEYFEDAGNASAKLSWEGPRLAKQVIPRNHLFPPNEHSANRIAPLCFKESQGKIVIEAENYTATFHGKENAQWNYWEPTPLGDASEGMAMIAAPNLGIRAWELSGPRLDYAIEFEESGTYHLYVRTLKDANNDGSFYLGLDGSPFMSLQGEGLGQSIEWKWEHHVDGSPIRLEIPNAGKHYLNLWMREDGILVDKIILKKEAVAPMDLGSIATEGEACPDEPVIFSLHEMGEDLLLTWNLRIEEARTYLLERSVNGAPHTMLEEGILPANFETYWERDIYAFDGLKLHYRVRAFDRFESQVGAWGQDLDLRNQSGSFGFQTFPNPASSSVEVIFENPGRKEMTLRLLDIQGRELKQIVVERQRNGRFTFSVSEWAEGIYFLMLTDGDEVKTKRLLVTK